VVKRAQKGLKIEFLGIFRGLREIPSKKV